MSDGAGLGQLNRGGEGGREGKEQGGVKWRRWWGDTSAQEEEALWEAGSVTKGEATGSPAGGQGPPSWT